MGRAREGFLYTAGSKNRRGCICAQYESERETRGECMDCSAGVYEKFFGYMAV